MLDDIIADEAEAIASLDLPEPLNPILAADSLAFLIRCGGEHVEFSIHHVPLDAIDSSWTLTLVPGADPFIIAKKVVGGITLTAFLGDR